MDREAEADVARGGVGGVVHDEVGAFAQQDLAETAADEAQRAFEHRPNDVGQPGLARQLQADRGQRGGLLPRAGQLDGQRGVVGQQAEDLDLFGRERVRRRALDVQCADGLVADEQGDHQLATHDLRRAARRLVHAAQLGGHLGEIGDEDG